MDDFNCVFRAGKRSRRTQQVGRVSDTSIPLPRLKTVRGTECVSSDVQQKHVVKRHTRATLQNPGHQGTYGGGMSDAPENSKTQTQFHQEVKCHTKRSFHPTNQAKCRVCYDLSSCWLFPLP